MARAASRVENAMASGVLIRECILAARKVINPCYVGATSKQKRPPEWGGRAAPAM